MKSYTSILKDRLETLTIATAEMRRLQKRGSEYDRLEQERNVECYIDFLIDVLGLDEKYREWLEPRTEVPPKETTDVDR